MPLVTDRQLLTRAKAGDEAAFAQLYRRYGARLMAYFLRRLDFDAAHAEDLRQQVFLRLLESQAFREAGPGPEDLSALLFTISANLLKNAYRNDERRQRREAVYVELARLREASGQPAVDPTLLEAALARLPDHQRLCLELRFRKGYSIEEVAAALACAPGTVKSRLHYGLKKMAAYLKTTNAD